MVRIKKERNAEERLQYILEYCERLGIKCNVERFDTKEDYIEKYGLDEYLKLIK